MFFKFCVLFTHVILQLPLLLILDDAFLLRFLRAAKFSQLRAQKTFENFWTVRTVPGKGVPEWFDDLNPDDETMQKCLDLG